MVAGQGKVLISPQEQVVWRQRYFITTVSDLTSTPCYVLETGWHREKSKDTASVLITGHSDCDLGQIVPSFIYILAITIYP